MQHVPLHSTASARAAAAAIDAFHISDSHGGGLGGRREGAFSLARDNARRRMSLDNSALEPAARLGRARAGPGRVRPLIHMHMKRLQRRERQCTCL